MVDRNFTREEFNQLGVTRLSGEAEIVVGRDGPFGEHPIVLWRFSAPAELTDFEVLEKGWDYYEALREGVRLHREEEANDSGGDAES